MLLLNSFDFFIFLVMPKKKRLSSTLHRVKPVRADIVIIGVLGWSLNSFPSHH